MMEEIPRGVDLRNGQESGGWNVLIVSRGIDDELVQYVKKA